MAVDLLDAPLRISWDLCPGGHAVLPAAQLRQVGASLTEAGVFFVTLEEQPLLHPGCPVLLEQLAAAGCQPALFFAASDAEWRTLPVLTPATSLLLDCAAFLTGDRFDLEGLAQAVARLREQSIEPSLVWTPVRGRLPLLPELLGFCREQSIGRFKLPNRKINATSDLGLPAEILHPDDLQQLSGLLQEEGLKVDEGLQLEIHDLFLWELLPSGAGSRSEYGGCQAANSLGHVNAAGELYPCSSWPEALGSLLQTSLLDLWQRPRRFAIREEIAQVPEGCLGCRDYPICFGGCRGLSRFCRQDGLGRDLLCGDIRRT